MRQKVKTFQENHRIFFLTAFYMGLYPPGIEQLVPSRTVRQFFRWIGILPLIMAVIYMSGYSYHIIFHTPASKITLIMLFRRILVIFFISARPMAHFFRYKMLDNLMQTWNNEINREYAFENRKAVLEEYIKKSRKPMSSFIAVRFCMSTVYSIPLLFNRFVPSSEYAGIPHDNTSPYHFYYVAFQLIFFAWIGMVSPPIEIFISYLLNMAITEMEVLRKKLVEIIEILSLEDNERIMVQWPWKDEKEVVTGREAYRKAVSQTSEELGKWVTAHQKTLRWIEDVRGFLNMDISIKYFYLAVHCSLVVIGLSGLGTAEMINDLGLILTVTVTNFSTLFYTTRQADDLEQCSKNIFWDTYSSAWYLYPEDIKRSLSIIAVRTNTKPECMFGFKLFADNSANFSSVLQKAYQVLTFVLPLTND